MFALPHKYRYPVVLAVIAAGILVFGLALKPTPQPATRETPEVTATRAELENLQRLVQRNSLRNLGAQFSALAEDISDSLFPLADSQRNAIAWSADSDLVPKPMGDLPRPVPLVIGGQIHEAVPQQWVPGLPVTTIQPTPGAAIPLIAQTAPPDGAWVLAVSVGLTSSPVFRPGIYNGTAAAQCGPFIHRKLVTTIMLGPEVLGGGVFDLQSRLLGIVVRCEEGPAIIAPAELRQALAASAALPLLAQYGMAVQAADAGWKQALGADTGLVITDVWQDWPAEAAGLLPGDAIVSVDGQAASALPQLVEVLTSGASRHVVEVRRRGRRIRATVQPVAANSAATLTAVDVAAPEQGVVLQRVLPGSSADRAGLRAGDRILQVAGSPATPDKVLTAIGPFQVSPPVFVIAVRATHILGVLLR